MSIVRINNARSLRYQHPITNNRQMRFGVGNLSLSNENAGQKCIQRIPKQLEMIIDFRL